MDSCGRGDNLRLKLLYIKFKVPLNNFGTLAQALQLRLRILLGTAGAAHTLILLECTTKGYGRHSILSPHRVIKLSYLCCLSAKVPSYQIRRKSVILTVVRYKY